MQLLNFNNFVNEKYNSESQNESVRKFFTDILNKIKGWFSGPGSWLKNLAKLKNELGANSYKTSGFDFYDYSNSAVVESVDVVNEAEEKNKRKATMLEHPNPEVPNFSFKELEETLVLHWKSKKPPFIWGSFGIGKTDVVKQLGMKFKVPVILINLSMRDPVDFIGLPDIEKGEGGKPGRTVYNLPKFFPTDNGPDGKGGIIFFDELNRASGPVLSASLQLFLDRAIDEYKLPDQWLIIGAGNRSMEAPEVNDLGGALSNRVKQYNLVPDVGSWSDWAASKQDTQGNPLISGEFINFLLANKEYFHSYKGDPNSPWPSPRSWAEAAMNYKLLKEEQPKKSNNSDYVKRTLAADVGLDAASAFIDFLELLNKYSDADCELVYTIPEKAKMIPMDRADIAYAVILKIVYWRRDKGVTAAEFSNAIRFAIRIGKFEYSAAMIRNLKQQYPNSLKDKSVIKTLEDWADAYEKDVNKITSKK